MSTNNSPGNSASPATLPTWTFKPRWRIQGCLVTLTPLHIGSGATITHPDLVTTEGEVEVNGHIVDHSGCACIFGSTFKGCLRGWLEKNCTDDTGTMERLYHLLGRGPDKTATGQNKTAAQNKGDNTQKSDDEDLTRGGAAEFHDAPLTMRRTEPTPLPYWRPDRQTWIETSTSIDRDTRTVIANHLIHNECVPPGVGFDVVISGCFEEGDMRRLLAAMEGFNCAHNPVLLGADTASGKGRMLWERGSVSTMNKDDVLAWIRSPDRGLAEDQLRRIADTELGEKECIALKPAHEEILTIPITLQFDSHFLVNDPPTAKEVQKGKGEDETKKPPSHRPRLDAGGCALLPAKSFRGALRSQAERILRTLGLPACHPTDTKGPETCGQRLMAGGTTSDLCLACQVFGAPGWRSPLEISDFHLSEDGCDQMIQEFVAIDRFTGGAKDSAKFNALALYRPVLKGCLRVRHYQALSPEARALLALTLRDLKEGDITFGFGAAKGYGTCTWQTRDTPWETKDFQGKIGEDLKEFRKKVKEQQGQEGATGTAPKQEGIQ
ncbi:RAMP superfamily CRISPR-associated protein [Desulfobulbus propionicus]